MKKLRFIIAALFIMLLSMPLIKADEVVCDDNTGECEVWITSTYVMGGCAGSYTNCVQTIEL